MRRDREAWTKLANGQEQRDRAAARAIVEEAVVTGAPLSAVVTKYANRTTVVDGIRFDSKLEADRYRELKLLRASGEVAWFIRQVPFDVAPAVTYRADFLIVWNLGGIVDKITVEDTKGFLTDTARVKLAVIEERYGIKVKILKRADVSR